MDLYEISQRTAHLRTATPRLKFVGFEDVAAGDFVAYTPLADQGICLEPGRRVAADSCSWAKCAFGQSMFRANFSSRRYDLSGDRLSSALTGREGILDPLTRCTGD